MLSPSALITSASASILGRLSGLQLDIAGLKAWEGIVVPKLHALPIPIDGRQRQATCPDD